MITATNKPGYLPREAHELVRVLSEIRAQIPQGYEVLREGLHQLLDPEMLNTIRVPPNLLPCAQGRAQVAQEVLILVDNLEHYAIEYEKAARKVTHPGANLATAPQPRSN